MTHEPDIDYEKLRHILVDSQAAAFNSGATYTNLISAVGYAGAFTLWGFARVVLTTQAVRAIAMLLGISLSAYIFWNVYAMVRMAWTRLTWERQLKGLTLPAYIGKYAQLEQLSKRPAHIDIVIWVIQLVIATITAFFALVILLYNCATGIFGFPQWP